ncbi:MAG: cytochrome c peroxidase [Rhodospirillales bacterium]
MAAAFRPSCPPAAFFPGSLTARSGRRVPQSLAYAAFAPVLTFRTDTADFAGGNFWDGRATGLITGSAAADQAMVPLTGPTEMALPDAACAVWRVSQAPYGATFSKVWGAQSLAITWPSDTASVCAKPNNGRANQTPLALSADDRTRATAAVQQIGQTIETFEASPLASPFTSKFDAVSAGQARFSAEERAGFELFTGRANCSTCHAVDGSKPLLTDFTSANIGVPRNPSDPYLTENAPDSHGYVANPAGPAYVDEGLGGFLASDDNTNQQWKAAAPQFMGAFQVATLRNVAARPRPGFIRTYTHNGFFKDLKSLVHFYNTRDVLPRCTGTEGIGVTCWPAPEEPANVNQARMGNLRLSNTQEQELVAFMRTLTDGYSPPHVH